MRYVAVVVVWVLIARTAFAHQSSTKYLELDVDRQITMELRFVPGDVTEPMKLGPNAKPTVGEAALAPAVPAYVASWITVLTTSGARCFSGDARARAADDGFVVVTWAVECPRARLDAIVLDASAFFALDRKMELLVHMPGAEDSIRVTANNSPITIELDPGSPWIAGVLGGLAIERLAFCLLIVLVASLAKHRVRAVAIMLGAYSLAYLGGSLSGIVLPYGGELVAATLIYAGAETALRPDWRWRTATFAAFGVVHGMANSHQRSILIFNIVATLVATTLTFAVFGVASSQLRRVGVRRAIAGAVCAFGIIWLVERLFGT